MDPTHTKIQYPPGQYLQYLHAQGVIEKFCDIIERENHQRAQYFVKDPVNLNVAPQSEHFVRSITAYTTQPISLYCSCNAILLGSDGILLAENALIKDTVRHVPTWLPESAIESYSHHGEVRLKCALPITACSGSAFIGFNAGWRNYAHWIQECLPKIDFWLRYRDQINSAKLVVPAVEKGSFHEQCLEILGINTSDIIYVGNREALKFESTFLTNDLDLFGVTSAVSTAAHTLVRASPSMLGRGSKIYIHRNVPWRRLANFEKILPILERYDFAIVTFEDATVADQIAIMKEARYVIGEHGAGLINVVFSSAGARVLELFNPSSVQPAFWSVSSLCGHFYGYLVGVHAPSNACQKLDHNSSYTIDPNRLESAIEMMLSVRPGT